MHAASHANVDETGWKQAGDRRWLWVAVTALCTLFVVATNRSAAVLTTLPDADVAGIVIPDRYRAYLSLPLEQRQILLGAPETEPGRLCRARGPVGAWGKDALALVEQLFEAWHRFTDEREDRERLRAEVAPIREKVHARLVRGITVPCRQVRSFSADVLNLEAALWTFTTHDDVEPTNNAAGPKGCPALRPAVSWRKGCVGADSTEGNAFGAKILTAAATCPQQQKSLLTTLADAVVAYRTLEPDK